MARSDRPLYVLAEGPRSPSRTSSQRDVRVRVSAGTRSGRRGNFYLGQVIDDHLR